MGFYMNDLKIVVVEDQDEAREMICTMLKGLGVEDIYDADNGETAIECCTTMKSLTGYTYDIIFCDWNMPGKSGVDVLREIRALEPEVPFIMITGRGDEESVREAKKLGVSGYILKPFTPEQLEAKIRIAMQRRKVA